MKITEMLGVYDVLGTRKKFKKAGFSDEQCDVIVAEFQKFYILAILIVPTFIVFALVAFYVGVNLV